MRALTLAVFGTSLLPLASSADASEATDRLSLAEVMSARAGEVDLECVNSLDPRNESSFRIQFWHDPLRDMHFYLGVTKSAGGSSETKFKKRMAGLGFIPLFSDLQVSIDLAQDDRGNEKIGTLALVAERVPVEGQQSPTVKNIRGELRLDGEAAVQVRCSRPARGTRPTP